jgi:hypothetical protein
MKKMMIADLIKASEMPEPGDPEDAGIENDLNTAGYSTGKWSDDDDMHPTITPLFGPNR